ncbi:MAG TPA: SDR family oxidoreductase [Capsulimonadaceae bacterium]|jgi:nucleoside-diphosphate-sugar epimerase
MDYVLVTGGAGFIGSHLVNELIANGVRVRILDDFSSGDRHNIPAGASGDIISGSITDINVCRKAAEGVDAIFHLAAQVSVPESVEDPVNADRINTRGTLNVLLAARDASVKRLVFSSSAAVYGDADAGPAVETMLPNPTSPYGVQKLTGEQYARCFMQLYGLETISLRYFNVYGARQNPNAAYAAVLPKFLTMVLAGKTPVVFGDGEQTRDFCNVHDVVKANILAATTQRTDAIGEVFNIAYGQTLSLNALLGELSTIIGEPITATYGPPRVGDIRHSSANIEKARSLLGFEPTVSPRQGVEEALTYYRSQTL